jgi:hypothetical protein
MRYVPLCFISPGSFIHAARDIDAVLESRPLE